MVVLISTKIIQDPSTAGRNDVTGNSPGIGHFLGYPPCVFFEPVEI